VAPESVISAQDSKFIYEVPLALHDQKVDDQVLKKLKLKMCSQEYIRVTFITQQLFLIK